MAGYQDVTYFKLLTSELHCMVNLYATAGSEEAKINYY